MDHTKGQNVVRMSVTHLAVLCVPLFCSYHVLTSSVICYGTDIWQHGTFFLTLCILNNEMLEA